jgi:hypothetical protein
MHQTNLEVQKFDFFVSINSLNFIVLKLSEAIEEANFHLETDFLGELIFQFIQL